MNESNDLNNFMNQNDFNVNDLKQQVSTQTIEIPHKRDKKQLILIVVMAFILILGITGRFIIFSINKNSNNAFLLSLGKLKTEMSDIVKPLSFLPTDYGNNYSIDGKMDINVTYNQDNLEEYAIFKEVIDAINKIDFNYAVKIDSANKKLLYVFNPTIDNEELINLKF